MMTTDKAQEPVAWRNAAIRLGEELSSVGPDGYYDMTAEQWFDWAMEQEPRGKNSLVQPEQEPVAWICYGAPGKRDIDFEEADIDKLPIGTQLYTTSPQRPWAGLTDEEITRIEEITTYLGNESWLRNLARNLEAKLKEKNYG